MPAPIAIGFVGNGSFAQILAEACERSPLLRIAACHDSNPDHCARFAQRFSCRAHGDFAAFCADPTIAGAIVVSPNDTHYQYTLALAAAGKHVFVEKPICLTLDEADGMIAASQRHGTVLAVGHQERRQRVFRHLKQMIERGDFGKVQAFEANHCGNLLELWPADDWRFDSTRGSGPLLHKGIHKLDILHYLFGPASTVATIANTIPFNSEMHQTTVSILGYADGVIGSFTSGFRYNNSSFNVYGDRQSAFYSGHGPQLRIKQEKTWESSVIDCGNGDPIAEELQEFALAMAGQSVVEVDGATAREALLVALAAGEAERSRTLVSVDEMRHGVPAAFAR